MNDATLGERLAAIELLVLDVDGVLTDGRIIYADDGSEIKSFDVKDGAALRWWIDAGRQAALISGRTSAAVVRRAKELGITRVIQGASDKLAALRQFLEELPMDRSRICVVGDDLPDLPLFGNCGLAIAVNDACPEVCAAAHWITRCRGGR